LQGFRQIGSSAFTDNLTLYGNDIITRGPWVDVRAFGTAKTDVPIQAAIDSLDNTIGGTIYIPEGTYTITNNLHVYGKSNVKIIGAGMGRTILDGSNATEQSNSPYSGQLAGILNIWGLDVGNGISDVDTGNPTNLLISDLSIKGSNGEARDQHLLSVGRITGFTMERVKIYNPNAREVCAFYVQIRDLTIRDSWFIGKGDNINGLNSMINTNTITARNVHIENNKFDNCVTGPFILGDGITIVNNKFRDCRNGIAVAESNGTIQASGKAIKISGNTFNGLGRHSLVGVSYGITSNNSTKIFDDNTTDSGTVISGNIFIDSYADNGALMLISTTGNSILEHNFAVGLQDDTNASSTFIQISPDEITPSRTILNGNVLLKKPSGKNINYGLTVANQDNTYVYVNGGFLQAAITNILRTGTKAYISLDGVVVSDGDLNMGWSGTWNQTGELNNVPLYGSTDGVLRTTVSTGLMLIQLDNNTTPSVKNANQFWAPQSGPITITGFTNAQVGQEITIYCNDNSATIANHPTQMLLQGGANFVCSQGNMIRLINNSAWGGWTEVSRRTN